MSNLILVTGGLGYIGSHIVLKLIEFGYEVIIVDNCCNSDIGILKKIKMISKKNNIKFFKYDICDQDNMDLIFEENPKIYAVIHLAALKSVPESISDSHTYYYNNVLGTTTLINSMKKYNCYNIIYSSSATVYGNQTPPYNETMNTGTGITNPYGQTKFISEQILKKITEKNPKFNAIILRYFNPVGAHKSGLIGESIDGLNLMPNLMKSLLYNTPLTVYGDDYDTTDGSCIRDFIHIDDLAYSHIISIKSLVQSPNYKTYNVGTGAGYTVLELINRFAFYYKKFPTLQIKERRPGDLENVYADVTKIENELNWTSKKTLDDICRDTVNYMKTSLDITSNVIQNIDSNIPVLTLDLTQDITHDINQDITHDILPDLNRDITDEINQNISQDIMPDLTSNLLHDLDT